MQHKTTHETETNTLSPRDKLIVDHLDLVKYVVNRMTINLPPGIDKNDLISIGSWGLIDAAQKFDPRKGVLFKTYALTRIRGSILDELRRLSLGGQALCRKTRNLEKATQAVEIRKGGPASEDEIAEELDMTTDELQQLYSDVSRSFLISLDAQSGDDDKSDTGLSNLADHRSPDPSQIVEQIELTETLKDAIDDLPDQEKQVLALYYFEELTLKEIGSILEVSESRISQIHTKAIIHLRGRLQNYRADIQ